MGSHDEPQKASEAKTGKNSSTLTCLLMGVLSFCRKREEKSVKNCGNREVSFAGSTELRIYGNTDEGDG
jgi:hypothetical protein